MPGRGSPLATFLLDALMFNNYPTRLFWSDRNEGIFCLRCIRRHSKAWTLADFKIFEDYHNLRARRTEDDMRQRFLIALRASPFIQELKDISSSEEKYYKILGVDNQLSIEVLNDDIETDNFEDTSPMDTSGEESGIEPVAEPPYATTSVVEDGCVSPATNDDLGNDLLEFLGDLLQDNECDSEGFGVNAGLAEYNVDVPNAMMENPNPSSIDDSQSFFNNSAMENVFGCDHTPDLSDWCQIEEENFNLEDNMYPDDYDPEKDLINSMSENFQNLDHLQEIPNTLAGSSQCEVKGLYKFDNNAEVTKLLQQDDQPLDSQPSKQLFMMVLNPKH